MTRDDIEDAEAVAEVTTSDTVTTVGDVSTEQTLVDITCSIDKVLWDQMLASATDSLVFIQWLESKRTGGDDD